MQNTTEGKDKHLKCYQRKRQITYNERTIKENRYFKSKPEAIREWSHSFTKELRAKKYKPKSLCLANLLFKNKCEVKTFTE